MSYFSDLKKRLNEAMSHDDVPTLQDGWPKWIYINTTLTIQTSLSTVTCVCDTDKKNYHFVFKNFVNDKNKFVDKIVVYYLVGKAGAMDAPIVNYCLSSDPSKYLRGGDIKKSNLTDDKKNLLSKLRDDAKKSAHEFYEKRKENR